MKQIEWITANIASIVYCFYLDIVNWSMPLTPDRAIELGIAALVALSIIFWNVARGIQALRKRNGSTDNNNQDV